MRRDFECTFLQGFSLAIWPRRSAQTLGLIALLVLFGAHQACADPIVAKEEEGEFGHIGQTDKGINCGAVACGETAAVNSFIFLQHHYPHIYGPDQLLKDGNAIDTINTLEGADYMSCDCKGTGTNFENFIFGKEKWIEEHVPGTTRYRAMSNYNWGIHDLPDDRKQAPFYFQFDWPTWDFLFKEVKDQEDVEILLEGSSNHWVTLTKVSWDDKNNDGIMDVGEAFMEFIDPGAGDPKTHKNSAAIKQKKKGGIIMTDYSAMDFSTKIVVAVSESPETGHLPEPGTCSVLLAGLAALLGIRRSTGRATKPNI